MIEEIGTDAHRLNMWTPAAADAWSVASPEELLERPERRRAIFYRGYDVYDPERVGEPSSSS